MCVKFAFGIKKLLLKSDTVIEWLQERQRPLCTAPSAWTWFNYCYIAQQIIQVLILRWVIQS